MLIGYLENLGSDRRIISTVCMRLDMLFFIGYDIDEPLPWHSTLSRTRQLYGYDARMCVCCGGTEISIDNVQNPNGNGYFLIGSLPSNFTIDNNEKFPIYVTLDWKIDSAHCFGNYIDIIKIARRGRDFTLKFEPSYFLRQRPFLKSHLSRISTYDTFVNR